MPEDLHCPDEESLAHNMLTDNCKLVKVPAHGFLLAVLKEFLDHFLAAFLADHVVKKWHEPLSSEPQTLILLA